MSIIIIDIDRTMDDINCCKNMVTQLECYNGVLPQIRIRFHYRNKYMKILIIILFLPLKYDRIQNKIR